MKKRVTYFVAAYFLLFTVSFYISNSNPPELLMTDVSNLITKRVSKVVSTSGIEGMQEAMREAAKLNLKVSIAGAKHSQGGHTFYEDSVVLDMRDFNKIISLDTDKKIIRVQSGATWAQIQEYINPYQLSVRVMQSSNIFTVGGSLSSNIHGRDLYTGPLIETVESFRLLTANGTILHVSREENSEWFGLVIGGFGLFGVILDVDLKLTDNELLEIETAEVDYRSFPDYFQNEVLSQPEALLAIARLSIAPKSLLQEMYVTAYSKTDIQGTVEQYTLLKEKYVERNKFLFGLSRKFNWGKSLSWKVQKNAYTDSDPELITRNNAMRGGIEFLEHSSSHDTDILQEYFVPFNRFADFIDGMRTIIQEENVNLLNASVRYVRKNEEAFLSYAKQDTFAIAILMNQSLNKKGKAHMEEVTKKLVEAVLRHGGTYYLTYQLYPAPDQMRAAYPEADFFFEKKRQYDKQELFMNLFYERYANHVK